MKKFIILILAISISSCLGKSQNSQINKVDDHYYWVIKQPDEEEYFEYIGELNIRNKNYKVINLFKRVHASVVWHGQSKLFFVGNKDTIGYKLETGEFPASIKSNQLYFPQKHVYYTVDSLSELLCIPIECVEKDELNTSLPNLDSVKQLFQ